VPREVSDHAEMSRHVRADVGAVLETVGFDAAECVRPAGFRNRDNYRLRKLLIGRGLDQPHQK
jgi:hypothetical protein